MILQEKGSLFLFIHLHKLFYALTHSKEEVYQLKKESLQELKELPLTDRGEQRLYQIESKLDREFHEEKGKESTPLEMKHGKGNKEAFQQKEKQKVEVER